MYKHTYTRLHFPLREVMENTSWSFKIFFPSGCLPHPFEFPHGRYFGAHFIFYSNFKVYTNNVFVYKSKYGCLTLVLRLRTAFT